MAQRSTLFNDLRLALSEQQSHKIKLVLKQIERHKLFDTYVTEMSSDPQGNRLEHDVSIFSWLIKDAFCHWSHHGTLSAEALDCVCMMAETVGQRAGLEDAFLHMAGRDEGAGVMAALMLSGQDFDLDNAFAHACQNRAVEPALTLIELGADPYGIDEEAVCIAIRYKDYDFAEALTAAVDYGAYKKQILDNLRRKESATMELVDRFYDFDLEHQHRQSLTTLATSKAAHTSEEKRIFPTPWRRAWWKMDYNANANLDCFVLAL